MKKLIVKSTTEAEPTFVPSKGFLNLYLTTGIPTSAMRSSLEGARLHRVRADPGSTICIERDANGDFSVTKIEEF